MPLKVVSKRGPPLLDTTISDARGWVVPLFVVFKRGARGGRVMPLKSRPNKGGVTNSYVQG